MLRPIGVPLTATEEVAGQIEAENIAPGLELAARQNLVILDAVEPPNHDPSAISAATSANPFLTPVRRSIRSAA